MASGSPSRRRQISATADAVASSSPNAGIGVAGPVDEQPHRVVPRRVRGRGVRRRGGQRRDGNWASPAMPSGSRLVASTRTPRHARAAARRGRRMPSTTCSQLSSTSSAVRPCRWRISRSSAYPDPSGTPTASATARATRAGSVTPASADQPHPVRLPAVTRGGDLDRQAGLAHPARPGQRHQPAVAAAVRGPASSSRSAPDERRQPRTRQVVLRRSAGRAGWAAGAVSLASWRSIACSSARSSGEGSSPSSSSRVCRAADRRPARRPAARTGTAPASAGRAAAPAADAGRPAPPAPRPVRRAGPAARRTSSRSSIAASRSSSSRCRWSRAHVPASNSASAGPCHSPSASAYSRPAAARSCSGRAARLLHQPDEPVHSTAPGRPPPRSPGAGRPPARRASRRRATPAAAATPDPARH